MKICFTEKGFEDYVSWANDKQSLKKINLLLTNISRTPTFGIGHPKQLTNNLSNKWSRRINEKDRIIYKIRKEDNCVEILSCKGHYFDK